MRLGLLLLFDAVMLGLGIVFVRMMVVVGI
jgi:hypothetical protein